VCRQVLADRGRPVVELVAQHPAVGGAGGLDFLERERLAGVLGADGPAQEPAAMKHPDLAEVARVVPDRHGLADVGGQGWVQVTQALEADAVAVHHPRLGDHHEQQVELLEAVGGAGQPAVGEPGLLRRLAGLAVDALVVGAGDPPAEGGVRLGEREPGRRDWVAVDELPGQLGQQLGGDAAEEPLDLAAALRPGDGGVHQLDVQVGGDRCEVVAGEVAAVVGVQHVGQAVHRPVGVGLAPDGLAQRQRQVQRRGSAQEQGVAGDGPRAVVEHDRQPRPGRAAVRVQHQQVQLGVVGLPDLVRPVGLPAVHQLVAVAQRRRPVVRQRQQVRVQAGDDRVGYRDTHEASGHGSTGHRPCS